VPGNSAATLAVTALGQAGGNRAQVYEPESDGIDRQLQAGKNNRYSSVRKRAKIYNNAVDITVDRAAEMDPGNMRTYLKVTTPEFLVLLELS
jgi:hypothetical protein